MHRDQEESELFPAQGEWERLREFCQLLEGGEQVSVDQELATYVTKVARQVALPAAEIEAAGTSEEAVLALARAARKRIRDGSRRLMAAISGALAAVEAGQNDEARDLLEEIVREEVVPWYREQARRQLVHLGLQPAPPKPAGG